MKEKTRQRIALSCYFFMSGFGFATWASRIPTLKAIYDLNEAELGNLLLSMPVSSLIGLPVSGWLVSKFESRFPLVVAFILFSLSLFLIGIADSLMVLIISICLFAFCMRIFNISMNTQSLTLQKSYKRKIIGSFHGIWSTGGLIGVGFSTLMIKMDVSIWMHLLIAAGFTFILAISVFPFLLKKDIATTGNKLIIGKPDKYILYLGLLVFFAALCEGGMYDWSGVYFKEVVDQDLFTLGYLIFMIFMAISRFLSDKFIEWLGMQRLYLISSALISSGILLMVIFPYFWPAIIGFSIVGLGVAGIMPMTYFLAGKSEKYSPGMAISIVTTYGIVGMLLGPPLIGYIAHLFGLKFSFIFLGAAGLMLIPISKKFFKFGRSNNKQHIS